MLCVIEGLDASGKSTQATLLTKKLQEMGYPCRFVHFPRYQEEPFGKAVAMFLRGDFGNNQELSPYFISLLFACDQWQGQNLLSSEEEIVILDRYYYSNMAYQSARLQDENKQAEFMVWLDKVFVSFSLLKPDMAFYLDVPSHFRMGNLNAKRQGQDRTYLEGENDIYEQDLAFQLRVERQYHNLCERYPELDCLSCIDGEAMADKNQITESILQRMIEKGFIKNG